MDFELSADQLMLSESISRYLGKEYDFAKRNAVLENGGFSAKHWADFAELGWLAAPFSEEVGGLGGGPVETLIIMEQFGRHAVLEPFVSTAIVGGQLLLADRDADRRRERIGALIAGEMKLALAATEEDRSFDLTRIVARAAPDGAGFRLSGRKPVVPDGGVADQFVVPMRTAGGSGDREGITLFLVPRSTDGLLVRHYRLHDGTTAAELILDNVRLGPDAVLGDPDGGMAELERACDYGIAAICSEAVGSAEYLVRATADYLKIRVQYGQPIARFQVVQHRLADMYMASELARSLSYVAALGLERPPVERARNASAAKAGVGRHARYVGAQAVQLHGGMGMSEELDVSHHFKRLVTISRMFGDECQHLARFAELDAA